MSEKRLTLTEAWEAAERQIEAMWKARRHASALHSQAQQFRRSQDNPDKASRFLGVTRTRDKWVASIRRKDERVACSLGNYEIELEAALAYDIMALALFGGEVQTNLPQDTYGKLWRAEWMKLIIAGFASRFHHERKEARAALRVLVGKLRLRVKAPLPGD